MTAVREFALRGDHIKLDALLKAAGIVGSGGAAKVLIGGGGVRVNGQTETRRGRKLRPGDRVEVGGEHMTLISSADAPGTADG
jgi:ribosome-associated protein